MFNVERSSTPEILKKEKYGDSDYRHESVITALQKDFFNKCYLCEEKDISSIETDHFIPIKKDIAQKYLWNNLFFSCRHCNKTKGSREEELLDCTNNEHHVYNWLSYEINEFPIEKVIIKPILEQPRIKNTAQLLNEIYNGSKKNNNFLEANNIRTKIRDILYRFNKQLEILEKNQSNLPEIIQLLSRQSAFSAFKRQIIKDTPRLKYLEKYFD